VSGRLKLSSRRRSSKGPAEVRQQVPTDRISRSNSLGLLWFAGAACGYLLCFRASLATAYWPAQIAAAAGAGVFIGLLFILGHDACHGALTTNQRLNKLIGRLAFLPSYVPLTSWEYAHNRIHHGYTSWRERDKAWAPFSKGEYDALSPLRRALERYYRSCWGMNGYYFWEYWLKTLLLPSAGARREMGKRRLFQADCLGLIAFAVGQASLALAWKSEGSNSAGFWSAFQSPPARLAISVALPFCVWTVLIGYAIYLHHTHPRAIWYAEREEWSFFGAQVETSVHIRLPRALEWLFGNVMKHTAHHAHPAIPCYRLPISQEYLEAAYSPHIISESLSLRRLRRTVSTCKLYDYERHCWLDFAGNPTTAARSLGRENTGNQPSPS
jgi:acyl-lipid omega-6 desaturase (Delta-12 desaturase)